MEDKKFNALDYLGKLAIRLTQDNRVIREQIVNWIIMLDSPDFEGTDAELVKQEMINLSNLEIERPTRLNSTTEVSDE